MKMVECKSSQMSAHGYDPATKTLAISFKSGGIYHYQDVPSDVYSKMIKADSLGKFLHEHVKGKFKHVKQEK